MDGDAEALAHRGGHGGRRARGILGALLLHEVEDGVGAFVCAPGAAGAGEQAGQPGSGEGRLRGVEGLTAHAKGGRDLGDRPAVDAMPAQHLVLHLHAIAAIEELMAGEGWVLHGIRARVEGAGGAQRGDLGRLQARAASSHCVNHNTY